MAKTGRGEYQVKVSLGLESAISQIDQLKTLLAKSIKPNTSDYSGLQKLIDKIGKSADNLKDKMENAFKTTSGTKSFLREYNQLMDMMKAVESRFGNVDTKNLLMSKDDQESIKSMRTELAGLESSIEALKNGKISNLFNVDDGTAAFQKIRDVINELGGDVSKITFDDITNRLKAQSEDATNQLEAMKNQIKEITSLTENLSGSKLTQLMDQMKQNNRENTSVKLQNQADIDKAQAKLDEYNKSLQQLGMEASPAQLKANNTSTTFIRNETNRLNDAFDKQKETIQAKREEITQALNEATKPAESRAKGQTLSKKELTDMLNSKTLTDGLDLIGKKISDYSGTIDLRQRFAQMAADLAEGLKNLLTDEQIEESRQKMTDKLYSIFDGIGDPVIGKGKVTAFKENIDKTLGQFNLSLKDIKFDTSKISEGKRVADVYREIIQALEDYGKAQNNVKNGLESDGGKIAQTSAAIQVLSDAMKEVSKTSNTAGTAIDSQTKRAEDLGNAIVKIISTYASGMQIDFSKIFDLNGLEKGKDAINNVLGDLTKVEQKQKTLSNVQMAISRWMGFYQVLNLTKRAVNSMKQHITELDTVMTKIAVVTNMSQDNLWGQIGQYSEMARQYGVAIKGVYEVSQLYYQQGLQKGDVMTLTQETLKMARIAGIEYSTAADYMTTAIRGFKLEMSDAGHVTDVFSNLAANTASSTEELAVAISKTASSAESVGSSFESTSAMMATMIATTRESATNIGSALKSIISRYGEMKENMTGTDSEGEEYSLNKVDKALQSVGITLHDTNGQFRDFDDVILELATAWDTIDKNTQRYIATVMAGNRQQSRFLSLVSNVEEYKRALEIANDSEGVGEMQTLKTLDSVDAKIERLKVTIQEFYTSSGIQDLYKGLLDTITNVINAGNKLPKLFDVVPAQALSIGASVVAVIKNVLLEIAASIKGQLDALSGEGESRLASFSNKISNYISKGFEDGVEQGKQKLETATNTVGSGKITTGLKNTALRYGGLALQLVGSGLTLAGMNTYGSSKSIKEDNTASYQTAVGALAGVGGSMLSGLAMSGGNPVGALLGGLLGVVQNFGSILSVFNMANGGLARRIELSSKNLTEKQQLETEAKAEEKALQSSVDKYKELENASHSSADAMQEFIDYQNQLADSYPDLTNNMDLLGNKVIELSDLELKLAEARTKAADATVQTVDAEMQDEYNKQDAYQEFFEGISKIYNPSVQGAYGNAQWYADYVGSTFTGQQGVAVSGENLIDLYHGGKYKEFLVKTYDQSHKEEERLATYQGLITKNFDAIYDQNEQMLVDYFNQQIQADQNYSAYDNFSDQKNVLKNLLKNINEQVGAKLEEITGLDKIDSLDKIDDLSAEDLQYAVNSALEWASNQLKVSAETINQSKEAFTTAHVNKNIAKYAEKEEHAGTKLTEYNSFVSSMISSAHRQPVDENGRRTYIDWSTRVNQEILQGELDYWDNWLNSYSEDADWLMNEFDFNNISNRNYINKIFKDHHINNKKIISDFEERYDTSMTQLSTDFSDAVDQYMGFDESPLSVDVLNKIKGLFDLTGNELTGALAKQVQNKLQQYQKYTKENQTLNAENYVNSLLDFYSQVASNDLLDSDKTKIAEITKDLDFTDSESLHSVAESLQEAGYDNLAQSLNTAEQQLGINVIARAQNLSDSLKETIKDIEKVTEKIGQGMKYSDAIESAKTIIEKAGDSAKGLSLTGEKGIIDYDKTIGEYVLTTQGISAWISALQKDQSEEIAKLQKSNKEYEGLYQLMSSSNTQAITGFDEKDSARVAKDWAQLLQSQYNLTDAETSGYAAVAQNLITEYQEAYKQDNTLTWKNFIESKQELLTQSKEFDMQILESATKNSILAQISSYDFSSIATGREGKYSKSNLRTLLEAAGVKTTDEKGFDMFETMYAQLLGGDLSLLDRMLESAGGGLSDQIQDETHQGIVSSYQDAIQYLTDKDHNPLTNAIQAQINAVKQKYKLGEDASDSEVLSYMQKDMQQFQIWNWATLAQVQETQMDIIKKNNRDAGIGRSKAVLDAFKDGFTTDELNSLQESWGLKFFDDQNQLIEGLQEYFTFDSETGDLKIAAGKSIEEVLTGLSNVFSLGLNKTSKLYKDTVSNEIQQKITQLDATDIGKQASTTLSNIASAKAGTRLDVHGLPQELQDQLGANAEHIAEITSEYQRDSWILGLDANAIKDSEWRSAVREQQDQIKSKRAKGPALQNLFATDLTRETMRSSLATLIGPGVENWSDEFLDDQARLKGFVWDAAMQEYHATKETLDWFDTQIAAAEKNVETTPEYLESLRSQRESIATELNRNKKRDALKNLLSSYTDVSDSLAEFSTQFGITSEELADYYTESADGAKRLNVQKLKTDFADKFKEAIGENWEEIFDDTIGQLADSYMDNISKASTYATQGTTSNADMRAFTKRYNELFADANKTASELFSYNTITESWTLRAETMSEVLEAEAQNLVANSQLDKKDVDQWKRGQLKANTIDKVDFKSVLSSGATEKSRQEMKSALETYYVGQVDSDTQHWIDYYKSLDFTTEEATSMVPAGIEAALKQAKERADDTYNRILAGGEDAAKALQEVDVDATTEDLQAAYDSAIAPLRSLVDTAEELKVGTFVEKNQIEALTKAGFTVSDTGLITEAGNLVNAYKSFYDQMKSNMQATTEDLNKTFAKYKTETERGDIDAIEAMGDAMGMTYETLGEILSKEGTSLETWLQQNRDLYESIGGGKVRLTNFRAFAKQRGWEEGSEEYVKSFSEYNDSLIEHNKKQKSAMTEELKALEDAQPGDWINLTQTEQAFKKFAKKQNKSQLQALKKSEKTTKKQLAEQAALLEQNDFFAQTKNALAQFDGILEDGILKLTDQAQMLNLSRVLSDAMNTAGEDLSDMARAELTDVVQNLRKSYTESITKGIEGGLTNVEAQQLTQRAKEMGLDMSGPGTFRQTASGLQLSETAAISYYSGMSQIDSIQAKTIYDSLTKSLKTNNKHYKNANTLLAHIGELQERIKDITDDTIDSHKQLKEQLEQEKALASQMAFNDYASGEGDWDFSDDDVMAGSMSNILEYYSAWAGYEAQLSQWAASGRVDTQGFITLLSHVSQIAKKTGQDLNFLGQQFTSDGLINGMSFEGIQSTLIDALASDKNGVYLAKDLLSQLGWNLTGGGSAIAGIYDAINEYWRPTFEQADDWNRFANAMNGVESAMHDAGMSTNDFFNDDGSFKLDTFKEFLSNNDLSDSWNEFADNFTLGDKKLSEIFSQSDWGENAENYSQAMRGLIDMLQDSEGWDTNDLLGSLTTKLQNAGIDGGGLKLGDMTLYAHNGKVIIKKDKEDGEGEEFIDPYGGTHETLDEAQNAINQHDVENYKKKFSKYEEGQTNGKDGSTEITIDGKDTTVKYESGKVTLEDENGSVTGDNFDAAMSKKYQQWKKSAQRNHEVIVSEEAWRARQGNQPLAFNAAGQRAGTGVLGEAARTTMQSQGLTTAEKISQAWSDAVSAVGKANGVEITDANWKQYSEAVSQEFQANTNLKLDGNQIGIEMTGDLPQKIADQVNMTQTAEDVMNGLNAAFANENTQQNLANAIGSAFKDLSQGEPIPVKIVPEFETEDPFGDKVFKVKVTMEAESDEITTPSTNGQTPTGTPGGVSPRKKKEEKTTEVPEALGYIASAGMASTGHVATAQPQVTQPQVSAETVSPVSVPVELNATGLDASSLTIPGEAKVTATADPIPPEDFVSDGPVEIDGTINYDNPVFTEEAPIAPNAEGEVIYSVGETPTGVTADDGSALINYSEGKKPKNVKAPDGSGVINYGVGNISIPTGVVATGKINYELGNVASPGNVGGGSPGLAKGTVGYAHAKNTLMGELGPEMVVSNGRYFVVGQNGPEFVDLAEDAIVFNHLQTQALLTKGTSKTRGKAITNEQTAVSYAKGSVNGGPAHETSTPPGHSNKNNNKKNNSTPNKDGSTPTVVNASEKTRKNMANKILGSTNTGNTEEPDYGAFIKWLEEWYTQLQKIAALEEKITYEETKRSKIQSDVNKSGHDYFASQVQSLETYSKLITADQDLIKQREDYLNARISKLTSQNSPWSAVYTLDPESGNIIYNKDAKDVFNAQFGYSDTNSPFNDPKTQYEWLVNNGFGEYLKYNKSGEEIKFTDDKGQANDKAYKDAVTAFFDIMDSQLTELQGERDDIVDRMNKVLEAQQAANEIAQEMRDNQIDVEDQVLNAIVEMQQREIDELQKQRDAFQESNEDLIKGLSDALNKERNLYNTNQSEQDLESKRRRLAILQRSGGSASEINSLQAEIDSASKELYFDKQQQQIDAIQEASDIQVEKMDQQIDLMQESLDYQKKYGMLWDEVYEKMQESPQEIATFIAENTEAFWGYSPAKSAQELEELNFKSEQWVDFRDKYDGDIENVIAALTASSDTSTTGENAEGEAAATDEIAEIPGQWIQESNGKWWYKHDADGGYTKNGWEKIGGKYYHFDAEGWMQTGWIQDGSDWYYLDPTQGDMKTGWIADGGKWYYANSSGKMQTGWIQDGENWYYAQSDGSILTNTTQAIDGETYTFDANGVASEGGSTNKSTSKYKNKQEIAENIDNAGEYYNYIYGGILPEKDKKKEEEVKNGRAKGGIVDETGIAKIHDNEVILTDEQTSFLRHQILGNNRHSLMSLLTEFHDIYDGIGTNISNAYDSVDTAIVIEQVDINMDVKRLANDYDARRAGDQIMDQMLAIARKTQAYNRIGR